MSFETTNVKLHGFKTFWL